MGPATFQQIIPLGIAAFIIFFLYLILREVSLLLFFFISAFVATGGVALAFLKINEMPLSNYIKNYIAFSTASKEYVWEKKEKPVKISTERKKRSLPKKKKTEEREEEKKLKKGSRLGKVSSRIETF